MENNYDYKTVYAVNFDDLDAKVTKLLNEGYKLYGLPYTASKYVAQAMIKAPIEGEKDE